MMPATGLYFGSFNPIHIGHLAIANYLLEYGSLSELWFVLSPQNPLKQKSTLLPDYQRLELVNRALRDFPRFKASNIEFGLPQPSFTSDTLAYLDEKFPDRKFVLIMGEDNLSSFEKWKNYEWILETRKILVYPRPGTQPSVFHQHKNVQLIQAPLIEISSSFIRKAIKQGKDVRFFLPEGTWNYIDEMNFYRK
ncbi:MAG: nicotinate (nicotinamide) nucleotide adenylyltransferase [Salinivirgaceae bacterium]